ncbi:MAG: PRC-barrel domain-containing protein [Hyphomicrobiaceae bacterium]|nr:PRC-barrel domain-containing protein [Hyphomicrobiaceae bacterium]
MKRFSTIALSMVALSSIAAAQDKPAMQPEKAPNVAVEKVDTNTSDAAKPVEQETTTKAKVDGEYYTESNKTDFLASKLIGARVYATEAEVDSSKAIDKAHTEWNDIGENNNIVIGRDGNVQAVVLGVGGFLGIGEKDVAVKMPSLKFVQKVGDKPSDYFIVVHSSKASLEAAPTYSYKTM